MLISVALSRRRQKCEEGQRRGKRTQEKSVQEIPIKV
jgi:hypothetical protein